MDGEATAAAFATCAGPDCLKDVIPKLGSRLKVYNALKLVISQGYKQKVFTIQELTLHTSYFVLTSYIVREPIHTRFFV